MPNSKQSPLIPVIDSLTQNNKLRKKLANRSFLTSFNKFLKGSRLSFYIFTEEEVNNFLSRPENKRFNGIYKASKYSVPRSGHEELRRDIALHHA